MLKNIHHLYGEKLSATDGDLGQIKDFYFDDQTWTVRYAVADTGSWLSGRQVLLPPHVFGAHALGGVIGEPTVLPVNLTRKQIEASPSIDSHRPVSRQYEEEYYRYYGWATYWAEGAVWGVTGVVPVMPPPTPETRLHHGHNQRDDVHLHSTKAITGYQLHATDGLIGAVKDFMVDDEKSWVIRELVVETGHWYEGKTILLLTKNIKRISYADSSVFVNLSLDDIKRTGKNAVIQSNGRHR